MKAIVKHKHNIPCSNSLGQCGGTQSLIFFGMNQFDFTNPKQRNRKIKSRKFRCHQPNRIWKLYYENQNTTNDQYYSNMLTNKANNPVFEK